MHVLISKTNASTLLLLNIGEASAAVQGASRERGHALKLNQEFISPNEERDLVSVLSACRLDLQ